MMFPSDFHIFQVGRSTTNQVGMLLDFYEQLGRPGSCMPMYNPKVSTTNDVVRHAIIPMSRAGAYGRAYANLGDPAARKVPPTRMVTHNWDNTFLDLVSAIVADALNEGAYEHIANQLADGHTGKIRQLVASVGALQLRYWICAFCVNQHAGICGGFGPQPAEGAARRRFEKNRRDTATNEVFELCHCRTPKVFSGDQCEMNKFDDMMALLHGRNRSFTQLVAVDREFDIFTRAWCVAELVQATRMRFGTSLSLPFVILLMSFVMFGNLILILSRVLEVLQHNLGKCFWPGTTCAAA
jgi:hypothetical protein